MNLRRCTRTPGARIADFIGRFDVLDFRAGKEGGVMINLRSGGMTKFGLMAGLAGILAILAAAPALAQASVWPQRSVKFILPFGAGSATDIAARLIGERLAARWGKPVIVENRPGGDGLVAINAFVSADDDHVLLYASSATFIAHPYTQEKLPYSLERDLAPIARVANTILAVSVPAATGQKSIADFVAAAKKEPAKNNVAGAAGLPEFAVMAFVKSENLGVTKVPYRDVVQAGRDLGENRIQFLLSSFAVVKPLIEAGKISLVAVGGPGRTELAPGVPTVTEAGYPGLAMATTSGFYGPKGMPLALRQRIGGEVVEAVKDATVTQRIASSGQAIVTGGPEELGQELAQQAKRAAEIAQILGMAKKQ
jgi:tripartite-type tricarboxylate transporter receptor subunit TctC